MSKPLQSVLERGRSLIADPDHWTCDEWASEGPTGLRRCAYRAVIAAATTLARPPEPALRALADAMGYLGADPRDAIVVFNDCHAHHDVLTAFDQAIGATARRADRLRAALVTDEA